MPTSEPSIFLSVIIPVFNSAGQLAQCLAALQKSDYAHYETLVVNDGSSDNSAEIAKRYPVRLIDLAENIGAGAARNEAVKRSNGEWLFFLDADILVQPDSLTKIVDCINTYGDQDGFFGSYQAETPAAGFFSRYKNYQHHFTHQTSNDSAVTFCGGFGVIKKRVFVQLHGFNPRLRSLEDIDLGYRLHLAGFRIRLEKSLLFTHLKPYTLSELIVSDVQHRAIPWVRLMLKYRIGQNDLNTKYRNIFSVVCAWFLPGYLPFVVFFSWPAVVWVLGLIGLLLANIDFLIFLYRRTDLSFLLKSILMMWFSYFYSGVGLIMGLWLHVSEKK
jgi:GT2 family glycosyltransferase